MQFVQSRVSKDRLDSRSELKHVTNKEIEIIGSFERVLCLYDERASAHGHIHGIEHLRSLMKEENTFIGNIILFHSFEAMVLPKVIEFFKGDEEGLKRCVSLIFDVNTNYKSMSELLGSRKDCVAASKEFADEISSILSKGHRSLVPTGVISWYRLLNDEYFANGVRELFERLPGVAYSAFSRQHASPIKLRGVKNKSIQDFAKPLDYSISDISKLIVFHCECVAPTEIVSEKFKDFSDELEGCISRFLRTVS